LLARARNCGDNVSVYCLGRNQRGSALCGRPPEFRRCRCGVADVLTWRRRAGGWDGCRRSYKMRATRRSRSANRAACSVAREFRLMNVPGACDACAGDVHALGQSNSESTQSLPRRSRSTRAIIFRNRSATPLPTTRTTRIRSRHQCQAQQWARPGKSFKVLTSPPITIPGPISAIVRAGDRHFSGTRNPAFRHRHLIWRRIAQMKARKIKPSCRPYHTRKIAERVAIATGAKWSISRSHPGALHTPDT